MKHGKHDDFNDETSKEKECINIYCMIGKGDEGMAAWKEIERNINQFVKRQGQTPIQSNLPFQSF